VLPCTDTLIAVHTWHTYHTIFSQYVLLDYYGYVIIQNTIYWVEDSLPTVWRKESTNLSWDKCMSSLSTTPNKIMRKYILVYETHVLSLGVLLYYKIHNSVCLERYMCEYYLTCT